MPALEDCDLNTNIYLILLLLRNTNLKNILFFYFPILPPLSILSECRTFPTPFYIFNEGWIWSVRSDNKKSRMKEGWSFINKINVLLPSLWSVFCDDEMTRVVFLFSSPAGTKNELRYSWSGRLAVWRGEVRRGSGLMTSSQCWVTDQLLPSSYHQHSHLTSPVSRGRG